MSASATSDEMIATTVVHQTTQLRIAREAGKLVMFAVGDLTLTTDLGTKHVNSCWGGPHASQCGISRWIRNQSNDKLTLINMQDNWEKLEHKERRGPLYENDVFVRDNLTPSDVLVCSIGLNDALTRNRSVFVNLHLRVLANWPTAWLTWCPSFWALVSFVRTHTEKYLVRLVEKQRPRTVIVCMAYYPSASVHVERFDRYSDVIDLFDYQANPEHLQALMRAVFDEAIDPICVPGCVVKPCALFNAVDTDNPAHYTAQVCHSEEASKHIAAALLDHALPDELVYARLFK